MFAISTQNSSVCEFLKALVRLQCIYAQLNDVDFSNSARSMSVRNAELRHSAVRFSVIADHFIT